MKTFKYVLLTPKYDNLGIRNGYTRSTKKKIRANSRVDAEAMIRVKHRNREFKIVRF